MGRTRRRRYRKKNNACCNPDCSSSIIELKNWMYSNNWKNKSLLKLAVFDSTGRGLTSLKNIVNRDMLIEIPYKVMISFTTLEISQSFLNVLLNTSRKLTMQDLLSLFLVLERHKGSQSSWKSYINSLPTETPPLSWLCSSEEMEGIFELDIKAKTRQCFELYKSSLERCTKAINAGWVCECCGSGTTRVFDVNSFTWAYVMVNTRAVYVEPDLVNRLTSGGFLNAILSDKPCMALCPYLDMFNHSSGAKTQAKLVEKSNGEWIYKLITSTSFEKHRELFISYGAHDNLKLLCEYGFFIPDDSLEKITFRFDEILSACNISASAKQTTFLKEKLFVDNLEITLEGASFNLKAVLYVLSKPMERDWSLHIFGGCDLELCNLTIYMSRLLKFKRDILAEGLEQLRRTYEVPSKSFRMIVNYLEFRLTYTNKLLRLSEEHASS